MKVLLLLNFLNFFLVYGNVNVCDQLVLVTHESLPFETVEFGSTGQNEGCGETFETENLIDTLASLGATTDDAVLIYDSSRPTKIIGCIMVENAQRESSLGRQTCVDVVSPFGAMLIKPTRIPTNDILDVPIEVDASRLTINGAASISLSLDKGGTESVIVTFGTDQCQCKENFCFAEGGVCKFDNPSCTGCSILGSINVDDGVCTEDTGSCIIPSPSSPPTVCQPGTGTCKPAGIFDCIAIGSDTETCTPTAARVSVTIPANTPFPFGVHTSEDVEISTFPFVKDTTIKTTSQAGVQAVVVKERQGDGCVLSNQDLKTFRSQQGYVITSPEEVTIEYPQILGSSVSNTIRVIRGKSVSFSPLVVTPFAGKFQPGTMIKRGEDSVQITTDGEIKTITGSGFADFEPGTGYVILSPVTQNVDMTPSLAVAP